MIALDFYSFIGRFHPLIVHLPIGFLLMALFIEWFQNRNQTKIKKQLINQIWFLGALSAVIAALFGWLLANTGNYPENELFWHRWLGVVLAIIAILGWYIKWQPNKFNKSVRKIVPVFLLILLLIEGHLGGNLTHGADYLVEYAPKPVKQWLISSPNEKQALDLSQKDSVLIYSDIVLPILESKCYACHNNDIQRGGLNMEDPALFYEGGENGPIISSGNALESELFKRITLPKKNSKFMPPTGEPLTYDEIQVVEWWIDQGADMNKLISELTATDKLNLVLKRLYNLDLEPKPWYETVRLNPLDSIVVLNLQKEGFIVKRLGSENSLLDIKFKGNSLNKDKLSKLLDIKDYITWFSLAGTNVEDEWVSVISQFPNLTRLELQKTEVSDYAVEFLTGLEHLESLNLYGTQVTDSCLSHLNNMKQLKTVYLWDSGVTLDNARALQEENKELEVVIGGSLN